MTLNELAEKLEQLREDGVDMNLEIRDDDSPEFTIADFEIADEEGRIYINFVEVEEWKIKFVFLERNIL